MVTTLSLPPKMFSLSFLSLLWLSVAFALPTHVHNARSVSLVPRLYICSIPIISSMVCKNDEVQLVYTPMGLARGVQTTRGAVRFSVRYATAARFRPPVLATSWTLPFVASFLSCALS